MVLSLCATHKQMQIDKRMELIKMNEYSLFNIVGSIVDKDEINSLINRAKILPSCAYPFWYRITLCNKAIKLAKKHGLENKVFEIKETILDLCEDTDNHTGLLYPYFQPRDKTANIIYLYSYAVNIANSIGEKERAKTFLKKQKEEEKYKCRGTNYRKMSFM